jgi:hypothetical protein
MFMKRTRLTTKQRNPNGPDKNQAIENKGTCESRREATMMKKAYEKCRDNP